MNPPLNPITPITAATAADPYPYYAGLVARQALYFDQTLRMWVASSADVVTAVLQHPHCRVRPAAEPVPLALLGSAAAEIFRHLVRMNDGAGHCPFKQAVVGTLEAFRAQQVAEHGDQAAQFLFEQCNLAAEPRRLTEFSFRLPVYVVARWLGMPTENWPHIAIWIDAFVRGIAPGGSVEQVAHGTLAAQHLIDLFHLHLVKQPDQQIDGSSGLALLARQARLIGCTDHAPVIANAIGFITQAYEATAGLIGNTLINLHRQPAIRSQVLADPALLAPLIQEVLRLDPPIQNTRRYLVADTQIAGQRLKAGDAILLLLAAANRDPAVNLHPAHCDLRRPDRTNFSFGSGLHACPGAAIAAGIAAAGLKKLLASAVAYEQLIDTVHYRPSVNARIPEWKDSHDCSHF
ncbi:cytochrome P450 [Undibacterium arcticum]|uniref:Cytochrome P450 n=1 Tax=Undibacterium arcticum TaxID=1762892 RepID=A0ABV7F7T1_9BURK